MNIERAEIFEENGHWRWRIVDRAGTEYLDGGNFTTRKAAFISLREAITAFDDLSDEEKAQ